MVIIKYIFNLPTNFTGKTYNDNSVYFFKNKKVHRYYGPAVIWHDGEKDWCFNEKNFGFFDGYYEYNQKQFLKDLNKQWLS